MEWIDPTGYAFVCGNFGPAKLPSKGVVLFGTYTFGSRRTVFPASRAACAVQSVGVGLSGR